MLPAPGADAAGNYSGNFAPDLPDAGSGDGAERGGRSRRVPKQHPHGAADAGGIPQSAGRAVQDRLCRPGTAGLSGLRRRGGEAEHILYRGGRSPLHLPVGTGFPPQLFTNRAVYRQPSEAPGGWGVHRHRDPERAGGRGADSGAAQSGAGGHGL